MDASGNSQRNEGKTLVELNLYGPQSATVAEGRTGAVAHALRMTNPVPTNPRTELQE
jgi:hypothetical protein